MANCSVRPSGPFIILRRVITCFGVVSGGRRLAGPACGKERSSERCLLEFYHTHVLGFGSTRRVARGTA